MIPGRGTKIPSAWQKKKKKKIGTTQESDNHLMESKTSSLFILHSEIKLVLFPPNNQNMAITLLLFGTGSHLVIKQHLQSSYYVSDTVLGIGDMQDTGDRNPCPHGLETG